MTLFAQRLVFISVPILIMLGLIPLIKNDVLLLGVYALIVIITLALHWDKRDAIFFFFGLVLLTLSEFLFISTGVEIFTRDILFFGMPIWLPVLWGYAFIMIHRATVALDEYLQ